MNDHALAARLATEAGQLLLGVREEFADADASERKAAGDKRSHDFLMQAFAAERPQDAVLSEEGADDPVRLRSERVWIVDPLDGTREFSELGRDDWAVHVALWQGGQLVAGAVDVGLHERSPFVGRMNFFSCGRTVRRRQLFHRHLSDRGRRISRRLISRELIQ